MDRGAWRATVHGVAKNRTRLSDFTSLCLSQECKDYLTLKNKLMYILIHSVYKYVYIYIHKESAHSAGDADSITGLGRTPGKGNGNSFQYSCLGNPMDRGAWQATVHGITKELDYVYLSVYI